MEFLLIIFSFFIIRFYYFLSKGYKKNIFLHSLIGALCFLISYILFNSISLKLFSALLENDYFVNELIISCFTIPFALVVSAILYKIIENRFKRDHKKTAIHEIGKE